MIIANIARAEGRGRYRLACMSEQDQKQYLSIRSGFINDEEFQLDTSAEDGVITIRISGRIGFGSAGKVKAVLMRNMREKMPIVMDMRETKELSSLGLSTLTAILNDLRKSKCHFGLLVDPQSQIMKTLTQTRIGEIVKTYSNRELAVTVLKRLAGVE